VPLILLSGTESVGDPFEHVPLGADLTLSKSDALEKLPAAVDDLLARSR
jgi:DNA-binding NarL/FixJ family response regulator